ncbi:MAG: DUF5666 domain-containing protein [Henriciella sp.]|nr:DUF5666 domain-containing protein [Henriciella sp.]
MPNLRFSASVFTLAAALTACGGGGSDSPAPVSSNPPPTPSPVTTSSTVSSGAVTGFSSIVIDGLVIQTDDDTVFAIEGEDDVLGDDSVIELGIVVTARSEEDDDGNLIGKRFEVDDGIRGIIESISPNPEDPQFGTLIVAGQTIIVDGNTIIDDDLEDVDGVSGVDIRDLDPALSPGGLGLVVEVSGFPTEFGALATRIDDEDINPADLGSSGDDDDNVQVVGFVDTVDPSGDFFSINAATFLVDGATELDDDIVIDDTLVGRFVEVEADIDLNGNFIALEVEDESDLDGLFDDDFDDDDDFDIEGILQSVDLESDPDLIIINGIEIPVQDASGLVEFVGQRVDIEGEFDADGVLVLDEVEIESANSVETDDLIASIDTTAGTFTTRLGLVIEPTPASRLEVDLDRGDDDDNLTTAEFLDRISVGDRIEARGIPTETDIVWTRIEAEDEDDQECRLQGPVDAGTILDPNFDILAIEIDTTGLEDDGFESDAGEDRSSFFGALLAGDIVSAESGDAGLGCSSGLLQTLADGEVSIEDDDDIAGNDRLDDEDDVDGINSLELEGSISELNADANTFVVAGTRITVTETTLIDISIVEEARGTDLDRDDDIPFGALPETLDELLANGDEVEVVIDKDNNALSIEDAD